MKKKIIFFIILLIFSFNVKAIEDFTTGAEIKTSNIGKGEWQTSYVGINIEIFNPNNEGSGTTVTFVNKSKETLNNNNVRCYGHRRTKISYPAIYEENSWFKCGEFDNVENVSYFPSNWKPEEDIINFHAYLTKNDNENLKKIIDEYETLTGENTEPGDYIIIEPMVNISGFFVSAHEAYKHIILNQIATCYNENNFCWSYSKDLFGGNTNNENGGLFYNTMYLDEDVPELGLYTFPNSDEWIYDFDEKLTADDVVNENYYNDSYYMGRDYCFLDQNCGRGIGIYKYSDIYGKFSLTIKKVDANDNSKLLSGAEFNLYKGEGCNGEVYKTGTTQRGKIVFKNLDKGDYSYKEVKAPNGYLLDSTCKNINISKNEEIKVSNKLGLVLTIPKVDGANNPLKGATFGLFKDANCDNFIKSSTSGDDGKAYFKGLKSNTTYYYKELSAPSGYLIQSKGCNAVKIGTSNKKVDPIVNTKTTTTTTLSIQKNDITGKQIEKLKIDDRARFVIKNSSNQIIELNGNLESGEYDASNKKYITNMVGELKIVDIPDSQLGTYFICETNPPKDFNLSDNNCLQITLTKNKDNRLEFRNRKSDNTCEQELAEKKIKYGSIPAIPDIELLQLFIKYQDNPDDVRKLLDFNNAECAPPSCDGDGTGGGFSSKSSKIQINNCLSAKGGSKRSENYFDQNNLSCYDESESILNSYAYFCQTKYTLTNNLGNVSKFYGKDGGPLMWLDSNNLINYYKNNNLEKMISSSKYLATSTNSKICYIYEFGATPSIPNVSYNDKIYFGDNNADGNADELTADISDPVETGPTTMSNGFKKYTISTTKNYKLPTAYFYPLTGKISTSSTSTTFKYVSGVFSKLNYTEISSIQEGNILFGVKYGTKSAKNDTICSYEVNGNDVLVEKSKLQLEFRIIDTNNPFPNNRNTNTNWCNGADCTYNNQVVQNNIINKNNSYDRTGAGIKYKIILKPSDILTIREYNDDNPYDNYKIVTYTKGSNTITENAFLYALKQRTIKSYKNNNINQTLKSYGTLSNVLLTN